MSGYDYQPFPSQGVQVKWSITICKSSHLIEIGCEKHTPREWFNFTDKEIIKMHHSALAWWKKTKEPLFALLEAMGLWEKPTDTGWYDEWL